MARLARVKAEECVSPLRAGGRNERRKAAYDCLLYVALNPGRAGIVCQPETFDDSSLYYREMKDDRWMVSIIKIAGTPNRKTALRDYKCAVYLLLPW